MKKLCFLVLTLAFSSGCAQYCHPQRSTAQMEKDEQECDYGAEVATGSMRIGETRGVNQALVIDKCMKVKGYGTNFKWGGQCRGFAPIEKTP